MAHVEVGGRRDDDQAGEGPALPPPEEPPNRDPARAAGHGRDERGDRGAPLRHAAEGARSRRYGPEEELGLVEVVLAAELGDEPPAVIEGVLRQERESRLIRRPERAASRRGGDDHHGEDEHAENARPGTPQNAAHPWPGYTRFGASTFPPTVSEGIGASGVGADGVAEEGLVLSPGVHVTRVRPVHGNGTDPVPVSVHDLPRRLVPS